MAEERQNSTYKILLFCFQKIEKDTFKISKEARHGGRQR
jgi:hypothetical protein